VVGDSIIVKHGDDEYNLIITDIEDDYPGLLTTTVFNDELIFLGPGTIIEVHST